MSSPGETPSSVLRETLLEFSRRRKRKRERSRRRRAIEDARVREREAQILEQPTPSSRQLELSQEEQSALRAEPTPIQDSLLESVLAQLEKEKETEGEATEEEVSEPKKEGVSVETQQRAIYLTRHEQSSDTSLIIDEIRRKECACSCCSVIAHNVPYELLDGDKPFQTRFIQKVFLIIFIKAFVVVSWLRAVGYVEELSQFYSETYMFHVISATVYLLIKLLYRTSNNCRKRIFCFHYIIFLIELTTIADFIACAVTCWLPNYFNVPRQVFITLAGVCLFFMFVGNFVNYDITDGIMIATAIIVTLIMSVHEILRLRAFISSVDPDKPAAFKEIICAGVLVGVAELLILTIMIELKSILTGRRFPLKKCDWFVTAMYII